MPRNPNLQMLASGAIDLKGVKEREFQRALWAFAEQHGWKCYYQTRPARQLKDGSWRGLAPGGWPDVIAVRDGQLLALELKSEAGRATPAQQEWVDSLNRVAGISAGIFRPRDAKTLMELLR